MKRIPIYIPRIFQPNVDNPYGYVYITVNSVNHKMYIGQHKYVTTERNYKGSGDVLLKAFEKYGKENFISEPIDWAENLEELNQKELYWTKYLHVLDTDDYYNLILGGGRSVSLYGSDNPMYGKHHTAITKAIISQKNKGRHRIGVPHTEETKQKLRELHLGKPSPMKGKKMSEKSKQLMKENHADFSGENNPMYGVNRMGIKNPRCKSVVQLSLDGEVIRIWNYAKEPIDSGYINLKTTSSIIDCCKGKVKTAGGYKWVYLKDFKFP